MSSVWRGGSRNPPDILMNGGTFSEFTAWRKGSNGAKPSEMAVDVHALVEDAEVNKRLAGFSRQDSDGACLE